MIKKIDHIGIAVQNIDEAILFYEAVLGLRVAHTDTEVGQKSIVAFMPVGAGEVELIEPIGQDGPVARFLAKRGEGIHHICFEVDNLDTELERLRGKGIQLINEAPYVAAGGKRAAFIHPKSAHGVLVELYERVEGERRPPLIDMVVLRRRLEIETDAAGEGARTFLRSLQRLDAHSNGIK